MHLLFCTIFVAFSLFAVDSFAADVLVLQSMRVEPFDKAMSGLKSTVNSGLRWVAVTETRDGDLQRIIRSDRPRLIVAIGSDALRRVRSIRDIPIIYLMVLNPGKIVGGADNVSGIDMQIPPGKYIALMESLNLQRLKVGLLYDAENSGDFVKRIREAAAAEGVDIAAREVRSPKDVPEHLRKIMETCNVFWMLPDVTVVTPQTVESMLLYAAENRMPVITFAGKYVESGALASLCIDGFDLGRQAGEMANRVLSGEDISRIKEVQARKSVVKLNRKVAEKLGISLSSVEGREF